MTRVPPETRVLVAARDERFGTWLRHRIEVARPDVHVSTLDLDELRRRRASLTRHECSVLVLVAAFGDNPDEPDCEGLDWLRRLRDQPAFPAIVIVAEEGNELTAVRAMRLGAADYLPRRLITPQRLAQSLAIVLRAEQLRAVGPRAALIRPGADEEMDEGAPAPPDPAAPPAAPRAEQEPIPRYTLLQKLGESERATVHLATSDALGRNVALKITRSADDDGGAHFAHEYQSVGALSHPSIVEIYDYGVHEGREYIAMEYFPCGDLKARLRHPISESESLEYLRRIAGALQIVHAAGIVHRDLKPPNVMLREDGRIVLIDFGIAKNLADYTHSTAAGLLRGSPYYMSPEQAQGVPLDVRSDLYSLGVILYEMLTGSKPYVGASAMDVLQQHVSGPVPVLPPALEHHQGLLAQLMAKSRDERISSADELLLALQPS